MSDIVHAGAADDNNYELLELFEEIHEDWCREHPTAEDQVSTGTYHRKYSQLTLFYTCKHALPVEDAPKVWEDSSSFRGELKRVTQQQVPLMYNLFPPAPDPELQAPRLSKAEYKAYVQATVRGDKFLHYGRAHLYYMPHDSIVPAESRKRRPHRSSGAQPSGRAVR